MSLKPDTCDQERDRSPKDARKGDEVRSKVCDAQSNPC